jgi:ferredoxin
MMPTPVAHERPARRANARAWRAASLCSTAPLPCGGGCCGLGCRALRKAGAGAPAQACARPGALPKHDFLGACVRCGLCVRDCPYDTLKLAAWAAVATGTPYFDGAHMPCEMCEDIPCVKACPTGALDHGADRHRQREDGPGRADRPGELPQLPRPALRRLLSRVPGDRQGDHARAATTTRARTGTPC